MKLFGPGIPFLPQPPGAFPALPPIQIPDQGVTQTESINPPEPWSHGEGAGTITYIGFTLPEIEIEDAASRDDDVSSEPPAAAE